GIRCGSTKGRRKGNSVLAGSEDRTHSGRCTVFEQFFEVREMASLVPEVKIPHDDDDRDQDPPAGPDQGLKKRKISKDAEPPKNLKSTSPSKSNTSSQPKSTDWNNPKGNCCPYDLNKPLPLHESRGRLIIPADFFFNNDLKYLRGGSTDRKYTSSITKTKATKALYTTLSESQGVIYEDKLKRKRLLCSEDLYKFSDGTLTSVRNTLDQMLKNLKLGYNKAMERSKWTTTDQKRSRIVIKDINQQLLNRRIMRSLEKFVGGRDYGTDYRLL
ncbi:hypothetical protein Tco_0732715, partial [Tanacetum coccineum]